MPHCALIVDFVLNPGAGPAFDAILAEHARLTLAEEPGCLQFDVLHPDGEPDRAVLIEVYQDVAAYEAHRQGARMPGVNAALEPLTVSRSRVIGSLL